MCHGIHTFEFEALTLFIFPLAPTKWGRGQGEGVLATNSAPACRALALRHRAIAIQHTAGDRMTTGSKDLVELMISIMQSNRIGLTVLEAAAEIVAANARFNMWVLREVKSVNTSEDRWMQLLDFLDGIHARCESANRQLQDGGTNELLAASLSNVAAELNDAPTTKPFWTA
jgi:hypothetical protein